MMVLNIEKGKERKAYGKYIYREENHHNRTEREKPRGGVSY